MVKNKTVCALEDILSNKSCRAHGQEITVVKPLCLRPLIIIRWKRCRGGHVHKVEQ